MDAPIRLILLVFAFVLFIIAGCNISLVRVNFGWLGLACLTAALWLH
jgi:hypothetical protein